MGFWLKTFKNESYKTAEKAVAPHSSTLAWKIPWTEEPGRLQSMGSLRVGHNWVTSLSLSCIGEGNGKPLQCSCLENPRNGEPGGLPSMGSHRVGHDWSGLAAAYKANTPLWINWRHWELKWLLVTEQLNTGGTVLEHRPLPSNSNTLSQIIGSHVIQKMAHKYEKMRRLSGVKDS